ncbi:MAG: RluA family pseudouridine synthase [Bacteroidia bacterium]|nr:RluA family pseudouridine synthase [Bacteroidia bacterium]
MQVLFEDNHLIAVVKRSGQTVQSEPNKPLSLEEEVKSYIKQKYNKPGDVFLGVIHRLDMPVNGIVLFARTSKALARMNEKFKNREIRKIYEAHVENKPPHNSDTLIHYLIRDDKKNFTKAFDIPSPKAERAELCYSLIAQKQNFSILSIELLTGRKHQIRAQLGAIGCPIIGDIKYGSKSKLNDGAIKLTAIFLSFAHPISKEEIKISHSIN